LLTDDQKEKAGELALALEWGYAELAEAVDWADELIGASNEIDDDMISVSLSKNVSQAITHLNSISRNLNEWNILRLFLRRFENVITMPASSASKLARFLYLKARYDADAPADMACFTGYWDEIDLAVDGISADCPDKVINAFLEDIRIFANRTPNAT